MTDDIIAVQHCCVNHEHRDPSITVAPPRSHHDSPSSVLPVDEALCIINDQTPEPVAVQTSVTASIIGSVIAQDVYSTGMIPACHVGAVDGCTVALGGGKDSKNDSLRVSSVNPNASGRLVHSMAEGSRIFAHGDIISSVGGAISLLAMTGVKDVKMYKKPRVGVLGISNSITECTRQISDASLLAVISGLISYGFEFEDLGVAPSTSHGELEHALRTKTDLILIINDALLNESDLKPTIERTLGGFIHFDQVHIKPSKHTIFATVPVNATDTALTGRTSKPVFSLPNDPSSALVAFNLFVLPLLNKLSGLNTRYSTATAKPRAIAQLGLPRVAVVLTHHFPLDPKMTEFHLAIVTGSRSDARLYATSINAGTTAVHDMLASSCIKPNALIILRAGRGVGIKGEIVEALLMGPVFGSDIRLIC